MEINTGCAVLECARGGVHGLWRWGARVAHAQWRMDLVGARRRESAAGLLQVAWSGRAIRRCASWNLTSTC